MRLKYVNEFVDRYGKARCYFRRPGQKGIPLPGLPGSREYLDAYAAALEGSPIKLPVEIGAERTVAGSIKAATIGYMNSGDFLNLRESTRGAYRHILEALTREYGSNPIALLKRQHVVAMVDAKAGTPGAAREFLKCLRNVIKYAINIGMREDDPTHGVRAPGVNKNGGFKTWSEADIAAFKAFYPDPASKERLALALLLNTAQRASDVVLMGRGHIRNGWLHIKQVKTGTPVNIPVTAELAEAIDAAAAKDHMTFLIGERQDKSFTAKYFSRWFAELCDAAGLDGLSAHGLRKAACRRLAEAGCSAPQIMAVSGHKSLKEVQRYIEEFDRRGAAGEAMTRVAKAAGDDVVYDWKGRGGS
jgi:integrase